VRLFLAAALALSILAFTAGARHTALAAATATIIPNPDAYTCALPDFIGFEDLPDLYVLSPWVISNVQFTTSNWTVADFGTGNYNGKYPNGDFTAQGTHEAWLPPAGFDVAAAERFNGPPHFAPQQAAPSQDDEFPTISGRLDFVNGPASTFSLLISTAFDASLSGYTANGQLVGTATATSNIDTGAMTELKVQDATRDIAYVIVTGPLDAFAVDSFCSDAGVPVRPLTLPGGATIGVTGCGSTTPAALPAIFEFGVSIPVTAVPCVGHVFLGWSGGPCDGTASNPCNVPGTVAGTMTANFSP